MLQVKFIYHKKHPGLNISSFIEFNDNACVKHNLIRKDRLYSYCQKDRNNNKAI